MNRHIARLGLGVVLLSGAVGAGIAMAQPPAPEALTPSQPGTPDPQFRSGAGYAGSGAELQAGQWNGGGGVGFLGSTPDGTALSMNGNVDYFVTDQFSVGPLLQLGVTNDMTLIGLSGQGKYWVALPGTNGRGKLALQSGIGFAHADVGRGDSSWLVPLGLGYDYTLDSGTSLTATALVNFTDLNTGRGADVMPGVMFGLRF